MRHVGIQYRSQGVAHETRQGEHRQQAPGAVAQVAGEEQQAEITTQHQPHVQHAGIGQHGDAGGGGAEEQGQGQQDVGIADQTVGREDRRLSIGGSLGSVGLNHA